MDHEEPVWAWWGFLGGGGPRSYEGLGVLHLRMKISVSEIVRQIQTVWKL